MDGTVIRAHQHAAGARREPPADIPAEVLGPAVLEDAIRPAREGHRGLSRITRIGAGELNRSRTGIRFRRP